VSDQSNFKRLRQAARCIRRRRRRQARRLLDDAYQAYLQEIQSPHHSPDTDRNLYNNHTLAAEPIEPTNQSVNLLSSDPESPPSPHLSPLREPDSPHSVLTLRVRPDTPPRTPSISPPSYSPVHSPRPTSPASSTTSSVEFVEEILVPPPRPRHYYQYDPYQSLESLITQFPPHTDPLPSGLYTIGPDNFDLNEVREIITAQDPDSIIPVFLPNYPFPYDVPVRFFFNLFPSSTVSINEIPN